MKSFTHNHCSKLRYRRVWQGIAWTLVALVVWLSLTPSPPQLQVWDKAQHFAAYGGMALWFGSAFRPTLLWPFILMALGVALEVLQDVGGYRTLEGMDMVANALGVVFGFLLAATPAGSWMAWCEARIQRPRR